MSPSWLADAKGSKIDTDNLGEKYRAGHSMIVLSFK
jgi:hypothetical protein